MLNLSGGELQRVAIVLCLGKPADIYLIDEPSAYLDSEQRIVAARVIKRYGRRRRVLAVDAPCSPLGQRLTQAAGGAGRRFILHAKKTAFIVEHDFIMATYLADRVIVYEGQPSIEATAHAYARRCSRLRVASEGATADRPRQRVGRVRRPWRTARSRC